MIPVFPAQYICWMSALSEQAEKVSLIAIGNSTMADDGIALLLLEHIKEQLPEHIKYYFWDNQDALTIAADLLEINTPVIIIDCADMGLKAGEFRWFKGSECQLQNHFNLLSTHGFSFTEALALVEQLGFNQPLYFFAIQPACIELNQPVSRLLYKNIPKMSQELLKQLQTYSVY